MKLSILKVVFIVASLFAAPASAQSTKDAFLEIKKSAFKKQFKHLAIMPLVAAPVLAMPEELKQPIMDVVLKKFGKSKYTVLKPEETNQIRQGFMQLYTPSERQKNIALINEHTRREILFQHPVDGIVSIQVLPVAAPFLKDKAEWGGTSQKIKHKGDGVLGAVFGKNYGGNVAASAIQIVIVDRQGKPVFNWAGGIEVLMQRNGTNLEELPKDKLWQKKKRVLNAAKYAVKPI